MDGQPENLSNPQNELEIVFDQTREALETIENDLACLTSGANAHLYDLDESTSFFQKAKESFPEKSSQRSHKSAGLLTFAKYLASENILEVDLQTLLNLDGLKVGKHGKSKPFRVTSLWSAKIHPSFHPTAMFLVILTDDQILGAFGANVSPTGLQFEYHVSHLETIWWKEITGIAINLDDSPSLSLDGIGYEFKLISFSQNLTISFSNPSEPSLLLLEKTLLAVATKILANSENARLKDYLTAWEGYTQSKI